MWRSKNNSKAFVIIGISEKLDIKLTKCVKIFVSLPERINVIVNSDYKFMNKLLIPGKRSVRFYKAKTLLYDVPFV